MESSSSQCKDITLKTAWRRCGFCGAAGPLHGNVLFSPASVWKRSLRIVAAEVLARESQVWWPKQALDSWTTRTMEVEVDDFPSEENRTACEFSPWWICVALIQGSNEEVHLHHIDWRASISLSC